jgi:hypothetical protein
MARTRPAVGHFQEKPGATALAHAHISPGRKQPMIGLGAALHSLAPKGRRWVVTPPSLKVIGGSEHADAHSIELLRARLESNPLSRDCGKDLLVLRITG